MKLTVNQEAVAESKDRHILVVAPAGCGKTTTLVEHVMRRLESEGSNQIVLTFSNKAADDVKEKISKAIPNYSESVFVGTVHEFASRIVSRYGKTIGLSPGMHVFESETDRLEILLQAIRQVPNAWDEFERVDDRSREWYLKDLLMAIGRCKRRMTDPSDNFGQIYRSYQDILLSMDAMDFDDLLVYAIRILTEVPSVSRVYRSYYSNLCVDEAQDLNQLQYSLVTAIAGNSMDIMLIGDPSQAIYGFAGASSDYMCIQFPKDYPDFRRYELSENFRSSREVIRAAEAINDRFHPTMTMPITGEFGMFRLRNAEDEAVFVAKKVRVLLDFGHEDLSEDFGPEHICIISRNRNGLREMIRVCENQGIPFTVKQSVNELPFESDLFKAIWLAMRVISNPNDRYHLNRLNAMLGMPDDSQFDPSSWISDNAYVGILSSVVNEMCSQESHDDFSPERYQAIIESYIGTVEDEDEFTLLMDDLIEWESMVNGYIRSSKTGARSIRAFLRDSSLGKTRKVVERGIILSTPHMTKGLEYDVVFILGVNQGTFPDFRAKEESEMKEERHSFFVSITRARRLCYVTFLMERNSRKGIISLKPSEYIGDLTSAGFEVKDVF